MKKFDSERLHHVKFAPDIGCNLAADELRQQVAANIRRQLPQAKPHGINGETVALVCGGPSLQQSEAELVAAAWAGAKVVCVNGTYNWCIEHNIKPSAMVMLDARQFNSRFVEHAVPGCRYLLASQCHPDAFEYCKDRDTFIWHACSGGQAEYDEVIKPFYWSHTYPITGIGTTVAVRAILLLRMLGYASFDIFGFDSCWRDNDHHAYQQSENDGEPRFKMWLRPKGRDDLAEAFTCSPWMAKQQQDFMQLVHEKGNLFRIRVRGSGLIAATLRIAAQLGDQPELKQGD